MSRRGRSAALRPAVSRTRTAESYEGCGEGYFGISGGHPRMTGSVTTPEIGAERAPAPAPAPPPAADQRRRLVGRWRRALAEVEPAATRLIVEHEPGAATRERAALHRRLLATADVLSAALAVNL